MKPAYFIRDLRSSGLLLRFLRVDQREADDGDEEEGEEKLPQIHLGLYRIVQLHQLLFNLVNWLMMSG